MSRDYISCVESAKMIRQALKEAFPDVKFSVRSSVYSGGSSINVSWIDGPNAKQVESVTDRFEGSYFDGMIDYKGSIYALLDCRPVRFCCDSVHCNRSDSDAAIERAIAAVAAQYAGNIAADGLIVPSVEDFKSGKAWNNGPMRSAQGGMPWSWQAIINRRLAKVSDRMAPAPSPTADRVQFSGSDEYGAPYGAKGYPSCDRVQA